MHVWGPDWGLVTPNRLKLLMYQMFMRGSWRRGRDSNPRYGCPYAAFRVRCFQPLSHLSKPLKALVIAGVIKALKWPFATALLPNAG